MKKFLLGSTAGLIALGMSAPAMAADLAARPYTKAPPAMVAAIYDWSGFYIGANGGYGSSRNSWDVPGLGSEGAFDADGAVAGGQIGYRWQAGAMVFGLEAQYDWSDMNGNQVSQAFFATPGDITQHAHVRSFGLFTGQLGYAWNNTLLYVKGGAAVTDNRFEHRFTGTSTVIDSVSDTRWGGAIGAGLEFGLAPNWSLGVEYDHLFMQDRSLTFATVGAENTSQNVDLVTARVNYRFGGPAVTRY